MSNDKGLYTEEQLAAQKDLSFNDGYKAGFNFSELKNKEKLDGMNGVLGSYQRALTDMLSIMDYMCNNPLINNLRDNILKNEAIEDEDKLLEITLEVKSYLQDLSHYKKSNELKLKNLNGDRGRLAREVSNLKLKIDEYENVITKFKEEKEKDKSKFRNKWSPWFR